MFWVYILRCADGSYYTGHTDNLEKRIGEHKGGVCGGYTAERLPVELVWSQACVTREEALRAVGAYLKERGATVTAFYVSNVEQYLQRNGVWRAFCANVAAMPLDAASTFIRPSGSGFGSLSAMASETADCAR